MTNSGFIPKHGGYQDLKSFQNVVIVYGFTVEFCKRYVPAHKMRDQLEGAARSGTQNIAEGSSNSGTSKQTELRLVNVARGSLEELLRDYKDFLRQHGFKEWGRDDSLAQGVRALAYKSNRSYMTYRTYIENEETAANCAICLIHQTNFLLDQQMRALEKELFVNGDVHEQFRDARDAERKRQLLDSGPPLDDFLAQQGLVRLEDGRVVRSLGVSDIKRGKDTARE